MICCTILSVKRIVALPDNARIAAKIVFVRQTDGYKPGDLWPHARVGENCIWRGVQASPVLSFCGTDSAIGVRQSWPRRGSHRAFKKWPFMATVFLGNSEGLMTAILGGGYELDYRETESFLRHS